MDAFRIFIFINLFCLFELINEAEKIDPYYSTDIKNNSIYYLDISYYTRRWYSRIFYQLKFEDIRDNNFSFTLFTSLSNSLNFTNLSETDYYKSDEKYKYEGFKYYYTLKLNSNYKYFLVRFISSMNKEANFYHSEYSPETAVELYRSYVFNGYDFIYVECQYISDIYFYFSFSFKKKDNDNITEYNIYYALNHYKDDIEYLNNSNYYKATNPRIKNNTYTFYYKLKKYVYSYKYILLRPGKETLKYKEINITRLPRLPYEFKKSLNITTKIHDYMYTNISNVPIGNEVYFIVVIPTGNITIKYKFSEENFYEDFTDMSLITPKYKYSLYDSEYYYFKKENETNFLLFEILNDEINNFTIIQTEKDEYIEIKRKKNILIITICVGVALLIAMIVSLACYKAKQIAKENNKIINSQPLMNKK